MKIRADDPAKKPVVAESDDPTKNQWYQSRGLSSNPLNLTGGCHLSLPAEILILCHLTPVCTNFALIFG